MPTYHIFIFLFKEINFFSHAEQPEFFCLKWEKQREGDPLLDFLEAKKGCAFHIIQMPDEGGGIQTVTNF
jgi:hypothetical protein